MANNDNWSRLNNLEIMTIVAVGPRPGTDFLHSLLDSHFQILTFDGWLYFDQFYKNAISLWGTERFIFGTSGELESQRKLDNIDVSDFFYEFAWKHLHKFNSRYDVLEKKDKLGKQNNQHNEINIDIFVKHAVDLIGSNSLNRKNALLAIYGGYALARGEDLSLKKVLLHQSHLVDNVYYLSEDYSSVKVVACMRDPRVYASKIEVYQKKLPISRLNVESANAFFRLMIDGAEQLLKLPNVDVRVNVLERIHQQPERVLRRMCNWIGINYDSSLMTSTWNGKEWFGDGLSSGISGTFDPNRYADSQKEWRKNLTKIDEIVIENLMKTQINHYGYIRKYKNAAWRIFLPFMILIPTKYEMKIIAKLIKHKRYSYFFEWVRIVLQRYKGMYFKLFKMLFKKERFVEYF